jgi:hypothetical protein
VVVATWRAAMLDDPRIDQLRRIAFGAASVPSASAPISRE